MGGVYYNIFKMVDRAQPLGQSKISKLGIILSGAPGVGKSTISNVLVTGKWNSNLFNISGHGRKCTTHSKYEEGNLFGGELNRPVVVFDQPGGGDIKMDYIADAELLRDEMRQVQNGEIDIIIFVADIDLNRIGDHGEFSWKNMIKLFPEMKNNPERTFLVTTHWDK